MSGQAWGLLPLLPAWAPPHERNWPTLCSALCLPQHGHAMVPGVPLLMVLRRVHASSIRVWLSGIALTSQSRIGSGFLGTWAPDLVRAGGSWPPEGLTAYSFRSSFLDAGTLPYSLLISLVVGARLLWEGGLRSKGLTIKTINNTKIAKVKVAN